jgi:hypothetical protein
MLIKNARGQATLGIIKFKSHLNLGLYPLRISGFGLLSDFGRSDFGFLFPRFVELPKRIMANSP